jgi:1-acyl-sn-glycerol-3-phosphate acyltransferase
MRQRSFYATGTPPRGGTGERMGVIRKIRAYAALGLYLLGVALFGAPHLYALLLWDRIARVGRTAHRRRVAGWQMFWGCAFANVTFRIMGIEIGFDLPRFPQDRPLVVVSNHPSGPLDGFLLMLMFSRMGRRDFRSIMKREVTKIPVIGRSCVETACAFLTRGKDKDADLAEIARCARAAFADRAAVLIFPEGTRFRGPKAGSGFSRVLPPKSAGLRALLQEMPDCPVLSVTIAWDREIRNGAHTSSTIGSYVGARVSIHATVLEDMDPGYVEEWLRGEWRRKDDRLAAQGT